MIIFSIIAAVLFFGYFYDWSILNSYFYDWMLGGDASVHFFGFNFFKQEAWHWPLGLIEKLNYPLGTSIVYTDSIPWLALLGKLLNISPYYQYHGAWILFCFIMQAVAGYLLVQEAVSSPDTSKLATQLKCFLGSLVFITLPTLLFRSYAGTRHYALLAHFLVIFAVILSVRYIKTKKIEDGLWWSLIFISIGIHFYFTAMILLLYCGTFTSLERIKNLGIRPYVYAGMTFFSFYALGYLVIPVSESADFGFGRYSANLLSWINSDGFARVGLNFATTQNGQREGFQYLGFGILLSILLIAFNPSMRAALFLKFSKLKASLYFIILSFVLFFTISKKPSFLNVDLSVLMGLILYGILFLVIFYKVYKMKLWKSFVCTAFAILLFTQLGPVLRSSGRLGWILSYCLIYALFSLKPKLSWVSIMVVIQLIDVYPLINEVRANNQPIMSDHSFNEMVGPLDAYFNQNRPLFDRIVLVDGYNLAQAPLEFEALKYQLPVGPVYLARVDKVLGDKLQIDERAKLAAGAGESRVLYVFGDPAFFNVVRQNSVYQATQVGGFNLIIKK